MCKYQFLTEVSSNSFSPVQIYKRFTPALSLHPPFFAQPFLYGSLAVQPSLAVSLWWSPGMTNTFLKAVHLWWEQRRARAGVWNGRAVTGRWLSSSMPGLCSLRPHNSAPLGTAHLWTGLEGNECCPPGLTGAPDSVNFVLVNFKESGAE